MTNDDRTSSFYDENAATYAVRDRSLPQRRLDAFLNALPAGASILELGCGGGQDAAYMIAQGFNVTAMDGSAEMARQAEKLLGKPVIVRKFEELEDDQAYDGIWAEASLLHVQRSDLPGIFNRVHKALKNGGIFHASFKAGDTEGYDSFGRYYNYLSADWLNDLLISTGWKEISLNETDGSGYDGKPTKWLRMRASKSIPSAT
ncbi:MULTISPECIES: class I SAM-dependent DNA methyltransferase [Rhizobium]|uniref:Cyclopropane fatty-acyl-phospholipid synthase-like methyltransferase n=1 Tax=Rhizobium paranaense TaxID=1650438 RepID=A0A7W8XQG3_9HYPH|nr:MULTISPECIES: class I SAM-dependent methyltransferase [Rhizobium]MBB5573495.1 cyclopropane fatty-acyl-phospholipid synthase-like methyltransferase [Rhizobium paranaense]PST62880.1 SAM-dependent methyltransferase [Rhizobium sp. SEMIA4064]